MMEKSKRQGTIRKTAGFTPTPISRNGCKIMNQHNSSNFPRNRHIPEKISVSLQSKRGFTLIELLTVISIISLLASVVLASLNTARAKARDAQLLSNIRTLVTAAELYYDANGEYPPATDYSGACCNYYFITEIEGDDTNAIFKSSLQPYLKQLPRPGTYADVSYKNSFYGDRFSRISYNRPWVSKSSIYSETDIRCDPYYNTSPAINCYVLTVRTETDTPLGPAETRIYIINGNSKIIDTNNTYSFGLW